MKKTNSIINNWKKHINDPRYITFDIQIDKEDFNEMVKEIEEIKNEVEKWRDGRLEVCKKD